MTGGRGCGKTRLGAEWVNALVRGLSPFAAYKYGRIALVGETLAGGIRALLPLSPVHLNAQTDGGDLHLAWIRRGRLDADSWLAEDIPLGEEREKYRIDFAPVGGEAVRSATVVAPAFIYSAAMREHDFPQAPAAIDVIIRQLSAVVGPGTALRQTVRLT